MIFFSSSSLFGASSWRHFPVTSKSDKKSSVLTVGNCGRGSDGSVNPTDVLSERRLDFDLVTKSVLHGLLLVDLKMFLA